MLIIESNQYKYAAKGPLDAKALVKTYAELLLPKTWQVEIDGRVISGAYNGLVTSVWLDKEDPSKNGIYYLYDASVRSTLGSPDVTNAANWHKITDTKELSDIITKITSNTQAIADEASARIAAIATIYKAGDGDTKASGLLVEEITRATAAEQAIAETIANLIGDDHGKTIRKIALDEIVKLVDTGGWTVSAYIADQIAKLVHPKASAEITIAEDGTLGIAEVSTDKFVQGDQTLIFCGGNAK